MHITHDMKTLAHTSISSDGTGGNGFLGGLGNVGSSMGVGGGE